jgi:hypothetical protein
LILEERLIEGFCKGELIYTQELRGIGKTYSLVRFAKDRGFVVIEPNKARAEDLRKTYNYKNIYGVEDMNLRKMQVCVVDEGINIEKLLNDMECTILTGFSDIKGINLKKTAFRSELIKNSSNKELSFKEKTIETLKEEAELLDKARRKALSAGNNSDYKLLIDNYKKVINLIQELEEEKNSINYTMNITMPDVKNTDEFVKALKDLSFQAKKSIY